MERVLANYELMSDDIRMVKLANGIREAIHKVLPEGAMAYKLLGLKSKKATWGRGIINTSKVRPEKSEKGEIFSFEELSKAQKGFFGNLNNLSSLDNLKNVVDYGVVKEPVGENEWLLVLIEKTRDSLNRITERKQGVIFRAYTPEEEAEYQARLDEKQAAELGLGGETTALRIDDDFGI